MTMFTRSKPQKQEI